MATHIIKVSLTPNDKFVLVDLDTGKTMYVKTGVLHSKLYIVREAIKSYFLAQFPGATGCQITSDAEARIEQIADWNSHVEDEW